MREELCDMLQKDGYLVEAITEFEDAARLLAGGDLTDAINEGVRRGYTNGYLRKSVVKDILNIELVTDLFCTASSNIHRHPTGTLAVHPLPDLWKSAPGRG